MRCLRLLITALLALAASPAAGQDVREVEELGPPPDNVHFERLTVDDGLPNRHVRTIHQDRYGYIWLGTRDGLARFDGRHFTTYVHDPADPDSVGGSWISKIFETRDGDLWILLGVGGIDRFDRARERFVHYGQGQNGLSSSAVSTFLEDAAGNRWIGTVAAGLNRISGGEIRHFLPGDAPGSLSHSQVTALAEDRDARLWVATCGGGLNLYDASSESFTALRHDEGDLTSLASDCVRNLLIAPDGRLWAATSKGLNGLVDDGAGGFTFERRLPGQRITKVAFEADGTLWAVASGRILSLDPTTERFRLYLYSSDTPETRPGRVNDLLVDHRQVVWIATERGLRRLHRAAGYFEIYRHSPTDRYSLGSDPIDWIFEDRSGTLWLGTRGQGVSRFARSRWKFLTYRHDPLDEASLVHDEVTALVEAPDARGLWVATHGGGLSFFNPRSETFRAERHDRERPSSLASDFLNDLALDHDGNLWVATAGRGLDRRRGDGSFAHYRHDSDDPATLSSDFVGSLALDSAGNLWATSGYSPLSRLDPVTGEVERFPIHLAAPVNVWTVLPDDDGRIWLGTAGLGLLRLDPRTRELERFTWDPEDPATLNNRTVYALHRDAARRLWIGTFSGGLDRFDEAAAVFEHFTIHDGLPSNRVTGIVEDGGQMWLGTGQGLVQLDVREQAHLLRTYDRADGLLHAELSPRAGLRTADGEIYFGGPGGLVRFRSDALVTNPHDPPVVLTGFSRGGRRVRYDRPLEEAEEVELDHGDRVFELTFAALDYAQPERIRYQYRLAGFDEEWIDGGGEAAATYTNIDPGPYVFQVRASNNDGVWNDEGLSLRVRILPPFWATLWFRTLLALALVAGLGLAFLYQRRRLETAQREEIRRLDHQRKTEELETARRVQLAMLPRRDLELRFGGRGTSLQAVGRMVTAVEVGGDYYDFMLPSGTLSGETLSPWGDQGGNTPSGGLVVACGDALGHGTAAGLVVGMAKAALRHELLRGRPELQDVLVAVNATLCSAIADRQSGMGLVLVRLSPTGDGAVVELAASAMPPVYVYTARQERLVSVEMHGLPLGLREAVAVASEQTMLKHGDTLVLLSDGLAERLDASDELWGYDGVEAALLEICREERDAAAVAERLLAACDGFAGGHEPQDDMTVVVLRLT